MFSAALVLYSPSPLSLASPTVCKREICTGIVHLLTGIFNWFREGRGVGWFAELLGYLCPLHHGASILGLDKPTVICSLTLPGHSLILFLHITGYSYRKQCLQTAALLGTNGRKISLVP